MLNNRIVRNIFIGLFAACSLLASAQKQKNVIDEVIWVVGDEPILRSDVENARMEFLQQGQRFEGDPYCVIPEQLAVQKLFLHQAAIDSVEVSDADVFQEVDMRLNEAILNYGSREKLEEYVGKGMSQIREQMYNVYRDKKVVTEVQRNLVKNIKVTPAQVRRYFKDLPEDSIPFIPTKVECQIITREPVIPMEEIERVKEELRSYTERVNNGSAQFSTLALLYSEDKESAQKGGEIGFSGRGALVPEFANVAFNLTDPKKVSKIVESEFGFHIIQLIDKRGDKVNVRHILRKPVVSQEAIDRSLARLDSIRAEIIEGKFSFEAGASVISDDKDTRNNNGLMANATQTGRTSRFRLQDLPSEVARAVDTLQVGAISAPFQMINQRGKIVCVIAKLKSRTEGHKATITEDFQVMKDVVLEKRRQQKLHDWVVNKIKSTYVRVNDRYKDCKFEYQGWIKQ